MCLADQSVVSEHGLIKVAVGGKERFESNVCGRHTFTDLKVE